MKWPRSSNRSEARGIRPRDRRACLRWAYRPREILRWIEMPVAGMRDEHRAQVAHEHRTLPSPQVPGVGVRSAIGRLHRMPVVPVPAVVPGVGVARADLGEPGVSAAVANVAKQAAVAVAVVRGSRVDQTDLPLDQSVQVTLRGRVVGAAPLGCVDADEPDVLPAREPDRVAVNDVGNPSTATSCLVSAAGAIGQAGAVVVRGRVGLARDTIALGVESAVYPRPPALR